jgi:hypothetical protein
MGLDNFCVALVEDFDLIRAILDAAVELHVPLIEAAIDAVPAAPDTARVSSSMKFVPPPGGTSVNGQPRQSKV